VSGPLPAGRSTTRLQAIERLGVVVYALVDWAVIMAPSLAVKVAADRGGMGTSKGLDLIIASAAVATPHALIAARRLQIEERLAERRADVWIAAVDALVVLALATTSLVLVIFVGFAEEHALLAERGFPVVALWVGLQLVAVGLAELTARLVFWWLEPRAAAGRNAGTAHRGSGPDERTRQPGRPA
jgi:hypothetical protein